MSYTLTVNIDGVDYDEDDLVTAGVSVGTIRAAYTDVEPCSFTTGDAFDASSPLLQPGQIVRVSIDGVVVAYGKVVERETSFAPGEGRVFGLLSAREMARNVPIAHPRTDAAAIDFNTGTATDLQPTALEGLNIGEMIAYILDQHADDLRLQEAAPATGSLYVSTDLTDLTAEVADVTVSGDVVSAIEGLLAMTKHALVIDPDTLEWRFRDRSAGALYVLDFGTQHVNGGVSVDLSRNFTAAEIRGTAPETTDTLLSLAAGDLDMPAADQAQVADYSPQTRWDQDHLTVGKLWEMADGDVGVLEDLCAQARVTSADGSVDIGTPVRGATPEAGAASISTSLPVIGLVNYLQDSDACSDGGPGEAPAYGGLSITLPTYSRASPLVPKKRFPSSDDAWYGTAFSFDPAKWEVAGAVAGTGDYGLKRLRVFNAPKYRGTAAEQTAWALVLQDVVSIGGALGREARFVVGGLLDTSLVGLGMRLQVEDTGGRATGLEAVTDLAIVAVELDPMTERTTIYAGSPAGLYDLDAYRAGIAARLETDRAERAIDAARALMACLRNQDRSYEMVDLPPVQICGSQVTVPRSGGGSTTVYKEIEKIIEIIETILSILSTQKGGTFSVDEDGNVEWDGTDLGLGLWQWDPDKGTWVEVGTGEESDTPWSGDNPAGIPEAGAEGAMWNAIEGILANLGKTIDSLGNVLDAGGTAPAGGGTTYGHTPGGGMSKTPVPADGTVPPTTLGGLLGNTGKTVSPEGSIHAPGTVL